MLPPLSCRKLRFLLAAVLGVAALSAQAAWYQVEVVVFRHLNPLTDGENWFELQEPPLRGDALDLVSGRPGTDESAPIPYQRLGGSLLGGVYHTLKGSQEYRPLLHAAWQQPDRAGGGTKAVHLVLGDGSDPVSGSAASEPRAPGAVEPKPLVQGNVRIRAARLLYADVDVAFLAEGVPGLEQGADPTQPGYVRVRESRKLLLNELHYFDHPLFGVILQVSRLQTDAPAVTDSAAP